MSCRSRKRFRRLEIARKGISVGRMERLPGRAPLRGDSQERPQLMMRRSRSASTTDGVDDSATVLLREGIRVSCSQRTPAERYTGRYNPQIHEDMNCPHCNFASEESNDSVVKSEEAEDEVSGNTDYSSSSSDSAFQKSEDEVDVKTEIAEDEVETGDILFAAVEKAFGETDDLHDDVDMFFERIMAECEAVFASKDVDSEPGFDEHNLESRAGVDGKR